MSGGLQQLTGTRDDAAQALGPCASERGVALPGQTLDRELVDRRELEPRVLVEDLEKLADPRDVEQEAHGRGGDGRTARLSGTGIP